MSTAVLYIWYMASGTLAGIAAWAYLVRFLWKTRGSVLKSLTGVALITLAGALALLFTYIDVNLWLRVVADITDYPGRVYIGSGLFSLLALAVILIWVAFERAQRK